MTYELAKQLKDAGFPQNGNELFITPENPKLEEDLIDEVYPPTLSELIEACGESFCMLQHTGNWRAVSTYSSGEHIEEGNTPEEAVVKLWLELNKK